MPQACIMNFRSVKRHVASSAGDGAYEVKKSADCADKRKSAAAALARL